ncbi:MAG TPA: hypothetical protein VF992_00090 [Thermoplasmata archaeon]
MRSPNSARMALATYLASLLLLVPIAEISVSLSGWPSSASTDALGGGAILLGVAWMMVGYSTGMSVSAYLGPGAFQNRPFLGGGRSSLPSLNPEVVEDVRRKMQDRSDPSLVLIGLGAFLTAAGVITIVSWIVGFLALGALVLGVAVLLLATRRRVRSIA